MKIPFIYSLKTKIVVAIVSLVITTVIGVVTFMQLKMERNRLEEEYRASKNMLNAMLVSVENQYRSILYHKEVITEERREQLKNVILTVEETVKSKYQLFLDGKISEEQAKQYALEVARSIRYQDSVGYVWINDTTRSFPRMIMHPTLPDLDGKILDSPEYNCALGRNENLFRAFVDISKSSGEGFVDYLWPKPLPSGLSEKQPKLSYVKRFAPWGWILGTGLYIDDIEKGVEHRIEAVKKELSESLENVTVSKTGYGFIFNSTGELIFHPLYRGNDLVSTTNPASGNLILDDMVNAVEAGDGTLDYIWDKPSYKGEFRFKKSAYITKFEPLGWYVGTSFYINDIEAPIRTMRQETLYFSLVFILIGLFLALYFASNFIKPLWRIVDLSAAGAQGDYSSRLEITRKDEFGQLAHYLNDFMEEIELSHLQLSESEKRFRTLFERSSDAMLIMEDGQFVDCNAAAMEMFSCPNKESLLQKSPLEISPEMQPDGKRSSLVYEELGHILANKGCALFEWEHVKYDGSHFLAEVQLTSIGTKEKPIIHVHWRDITEAKQIREAKLRAEEQLLQMQKMETVGTLAGGFAHDFNNILSGIVGTLSLLRYEFDEDGRIESGNLKEGLEIMEQSGERAEKMVRQLLTLSRKQTLHFESVDLNKALENVVKLARGSLDKSVVIETHYSEIPATIHADPTQIEQILLNFCVNSAHAMTIMRDKNEKWGGLLTLELHFVNAGEEFCRTHPEAFPGPYWCVTIRDTGVGMNRDTLSKIFTPFYTTKEKGMGTGLGLSMVYNIIKQHQGFVNVYSEVGDGTSFETYIPALTNREYNPLSEKQELTLSNEGTILVIDDETLMLNMAEKMLTKCGYRVLVASDGAEGLDIFQERHKEISVVLLDMAMPGLSGKDVFVALKSIDADVKVLLTSGFQQDERVQEILELGVKGFVQKPYRLQSLGDAVGAIIKGENKES